MEKALPMFYFRNFGSSERSIDLVYGYTPSQRLKPKNQQ